MQKLLNIDNLISSISIGALQARCTLMIPQEGKKRSFLDAVFRTGNPFARPFVIRVDPGYLMSGIFHLVMKNN